MRWDAVAVTDPGRLRPGNEDAYLLDREAGLVAIADGLGGHAAGEVASQLALDVLAEKVGRGAADPDVTRDTLQATLADAVRAANAAITRRARQVPSLEGMGTTLTALILLASEPAGLVAHVGDSRAYLFRDGRLSQMTKDHTWVQQQVELGMLGPDQARGHPFGNVLVRALGTADEVDVDVLDEELRPGDIVLLCSDGLSGPVHDGEMAAILNAAQDLDAAARELVGTANARGGPDNITVALVRIREA